VGLEPQDLFQKIKESKWAWLIYIPMTVPLVFAFMLSGTCLGPLVSAIIIFGIPFIFGVRGLGKFFKVGTVIVLISGIVFGIAFTSFIYDQSYLFEERTLGNDALTEGIVTPYQGDPGDTFNFTITYKGSEPVENVSVFVNITNLGGGDLRNLTMNRSGNLFYIEEDFGNSLYFYRFDINLSAEGKWLHTQSGYGPLTMDYSEMLGIQIIQGIIFLFLWAGLFFYMVLVLYWWGTGVRKRTERKRKKGMRRKRRMMEKKGRMRNPRTDPRRSLKNSNVQNAVPPYLPMQMYVHPVAKGSRTIKICISRKVLSSGLLCSCPLWISACLL
jgi:hypothetical protein